MLLYRWTCPLGHHTEVAAAVGLAPPSTADRYCPHVDADGSVCHEPMRCEVDYQEPTTTVEPHPSVDWRDLDSWRRENGYVLALFTDRGEEGDPAEVAAITTTATGQGQLILGNTGWVTERFTYEGGMADAVTALVQWKLAGWADEPQGWHRHQPSDRRRPGGDPDQEYVAP